MGRSIRKKKTKRTKQKKDKFQLIKKACKQFGKPIFCMRHLKTDGNIISESFIGKTYNKLIGKKGGSLKHYLPFMLPGIREPTISAWGRNDVKALPTKYHITKTNNNHYTVIVSPLMRTWISALLFIRALMKGNKFSLTLIISPCIEQSGFTPVHPLENSYHRFKGEVKDNETIQFKYCNNINRKKYTCSLIDVIDSKTMYSDIKKSKAYKAYNKGGFRVDETLYMISNSCKDEFKNMKQILMYAHSGVLRNYMTYLGFPHDKVKKLKGINGYALVFTVRNNKFEVKLKYP